MPGQCDGNGGVPWALMHSLPLLTRKRRAPTHRALKGERVAQTVEHVTFNHGVLGSIPSALTKKINSLGPTFPKPFSMLPTPRQPSCANQWVQAKASCARSSIQIIVVQIAHGFQQRSRHYAVLHHSR
jgi:hypothetical protein